MQQANEDLKKLLRGNLEAVHNGENFNVFRLLGLESNEVTLHSRFIAGLVDPKDSHDQGSFFLQMFLQQVAKVLPRDDWIESSEVWVKQEHYIGNVNINGADSTGGYIDIFISDDTRHISIENKIRHGEGDYQIDRYCNHDPDRNFVLFLTLDGKQANTTKRNYKPISYKKHIIPWLEDCYKHCADFPILRETIGQYLHTIKRLTGSEDLKRLMRENVEAACTVDEAVKKFAKKLEEKIKEKLSAGDWEVENTIENEPNESGRGVIIKNGKWEDIGGIKWQREPKEVSQTSHYGVLVPEVPDGQFDRNEIRERLGEATNELKFVPKGPEGRWWIFVKYMDKANFQSDINELKKLFDDDEQDELVKQLANRLVTLAKACDCKLAD